MSSYRRVLRHQDFKYLFLGQAASGVGDQVVIVALALYVTRRTGSPSDLGLVLAAGSLPLIVLLLFGGVWADRLPRHRIMVVCDIVRAALHGLLAVLIFAGGASIWQLVVIEALFGAARAFFQPAYTGLIPQTVPESLIQDAQALTQTFANLAFLIGPALATALVLGVGAGEAFAFDALTFVFSAALLTRVRPRARVGEAEAAHEPIVRALRSGWDEVRSRPWVWVTIAVFTGAVLTVYAQWYSLAPLIARDSYGSAGVFGVLEAAGGAGAVIGAIVGARWRPARPLYAAFLLILPWPVMAATFALAAPVALVIALVVACGFGWALFGIWWETALATWIPAHALSRVSAYDWMGSLALMPLGFAVAGPLASSFGARTVLGVGSALGFVLLLIGLAPRSTRELGRRDDGSAEQLAGQVAVKPGGVAEVTDVDALVGVVHQRGGVEQAHVTVREEPVRGAVRKGLAKPARIREPGEQDGHGSGTRVVR
jgi:MFS family permease